MAFLCCGLEFTLQQSLEIVTNHKDLRRVLDVWRKEKAEIGFVPTMGALHEGHLDLVKKSNHDNDYTVVSIFVNPKQFNNQQDFILYPNPIDNDKQLLKNEDCDLLYLPDYDDVYPKNLEDVVLDLGNIDKVLEGPKRPGHFNGVVQVVHRFFDLIQPDRAYFGLKDFQQCMVIKLLRNQYFKSIELVFCPTVREKSGLAMSSRNARLSEKGLVSAVNVYKSLHAVMKLFDQVVPEDALKYGKYLLENQGFQVEYFELANSENLNISRKWLKKGKNVVLVAAWIEGVRLIDNLVF